MAKKALLVSESSVYKDDGDNLVARGGGAVCFHNIAKTLVSLGIEPTVFSIREFKEQKVDEIIDGVLYRRMDVKSRSSFKLVKYLKKALKDSRDYDFVFLNQFSPHLILPWLKKKHSVAVIHDVYKNNESVFWFRQFGLFTGFFGRFVERLQLRFDKKYASKIMTVSNGSAEKILGVLGESVEEKIVINPYPIDSDDYISDMEKENFILFVGRFIGYKHPEHVLKAIKKIKEKYPDYKAVFVVPREYKKIKSLFDQCKKDLGLSSEDVICKECCTADELKQLLAKAKVLVQPSYVEGQGIIILEALASGTPVVAYDLEAYDGMLLDGKNSLLVEKGDVDGFADSCIKLLENYQEYRNNCHISLNDFSREGFVNSMKELLT